MNFKKIILLLIGSGYFSFGMCQSMEESKATISSSKWDNSVHVKGLFESDVVGLEIGYKSLYKISDLIRLGWGTGLVSYNATTRRSFLPITIEYNADLTDKFKFIPFYALSAGYSLGFTEDPEFAESSRGGLRLEGGVGVRSNAAKLQPYIMVGYHLQKAYYPGGDGSGNFNKRVNYERLSFSFGLMF